MNYEKWEIAKNKKLIRDNYFKGEENYGHILKDTTLNLYDDIRGGKDDSKSVIHYFDTNDIVWHKNGGKPTGSTISSQVACLNHLFPIRNNYEAVREMVKNIDSRFEDVLEVKCGDVEEKEKTYIAFEVIGGKNLLDERGRKRGMFCTSIDALIRAKEKEGEICIILIEWKYTESYNRREDKSDEGKTGKNRMQRYNKLIQKSLSLRPLCKMDMSDDYYGGANEYRGSVYYQEPFYELMRQTLWAELIIGRIENDTAKISGEEPIKASDYFHLLVVPKANKALRDTGFDGFNTMEETWRHYLTKDGLERFKIIDPEELFKPFIKQEASIKIPDDFIGYLKTRYWRNDLEKDFESAVNKTEELIKDGTKGWVKRFSDYADELNKKIKDYEVKGEKIKEIIAELNIPDEVQLYSSVAKVKGSKRTVCYELRFCGQRICGVNVSDSDVENPKIQVSDDDRKRNKKWFGIDDISRGPLNGAKGFFDNFKSCSIGKVKSREHKFESLVLRKMAKEKGEMEDFRDIEPVKLGAGFFQMPTAVKAGTLVPEISRKEKGDIVCGHIDILARVSCPNGGWMPAVIEVKDENKPVEPVEDVMIQALIYATFLGHLLADKDCGETWYNIIGGKDQNGKCPVPDTIDILVVAMMPPKKDGEPDKINEAPKPFEVGDNDKKKTISLIPCTCYIDTDENFTTINGVKWSCFKKNG